MDEREPESEAESSDDAVSWEFWIHQMPWNADFFSSPGIVQNITRDQVRDR